MLSVAASKLESTLCFVASAAGGEGEEEEEERMLLNLVFFLRRVRMHVLNSTGQR